MADSTFESVLTGQLLEYADGGVRPVDRYAIADQAISIGHDSRWPIRGRTALVFGLALLVLAVAVALAGGLLRFPDPIHVPWTYRGVLAPAPDMATPRAQPLLVTLKDGRVLIVGGEPATAEVFDPSTGLTEITGQMVPADVFSAAALLDDGRVLLVGDARPADAPFFAVAQVFDPVTLQFDPVGPMVTPRAEAKLARLDDGRVLMTGGTPPDAINDTLASAEVFDPVTDTFAATGSMSTSRSFHSMTTLPDGRVLVVGGETASGGGAVTVDAAEMFDPSGGTFSEAGRTVAGRNLTVVLADGRIVVFGQSSDPGLMPAPVAILDPRSETFVRSTDLPEAPGTATLLDDGRILVTGWWQAGRWTGLFDPATGVTTEGASAAAWVPASARLADGRVLLAGGLVDGDLHGEGGHNAPPVATKEIFE